MAKRIVGGMVGVPNPQSDWNQTDPKKADYIKNKPNLNAKADKADVEQLADELNSQIENVAWQLSDAIFEKADKTHVETLEETVHQAEEDIFDLKNDKADTTYVDDKVANIKITTDDKLSTTSTNPVQNKVITAELNKKANKELAFDDYIRAEPNWETGTADFDFDSYTTDGVYKLWQSGVWDDTLSTQYILCVDTNYEGHVNQTLICLSNGTIKTRSLGGEWEVISVSQNDIKSFATKTELTNAIGDIETSLENIIAKYGLGGDSV